MSELTVTFLGTGGSTPTKDRGFPATLIQRGGDKLLFDCGEGTQRQMARFGGLIDVDAIFITHFHSDHTAGLPGLLGTYSMRGRTEPLTVYGPLGLNEYGRKLRFLHGTLDYELTYHELVGSPLPAITFGEYFVRPIPVEHRGAAYGYLFSELNRPGRFDVVKADNLGLHVEDRKRLQDGRTMQTYKGDLITPEDVMGPSRPGRKIVISGDTSPCDAIMGAANHADLLIHEATFTVNEKDKAKRVGHSTARQVGLLAIQAHPRKLALHHLSPRVGARVLIEEVRECGYDDVFVPRDGDRYEIGLRDA